MENQESPRRSSSERSMRVNRRRSRSRSSDIHTRSRVRHFSSEEGREPRVSRRSEHCRVRENPGESSCLGVFGLSTRTREEELREVFAEFGHIAKINVIHDRYTGYSRGFAFVYYERVQHARRARESLHNTVIGEKSIRVDFSITKKPHFPISEKYMGNRERRGGRDRDRFRDYGSSHRRERGSFRNKDERTHSRRRRPYSRSPRR